MFENIEQMSDEQILERCMEIYNTYSLDELKIVFGKDYRLFMELIYELIRRKQNEINY